MTRSRAINYFFCSTVHGPAASSANIKAISCFHYNCPSDIPAVLYDERSAWRELLVAKEIVAGKQPINALQHSIRGQTRWTDTVNKPFPGCLLKLLNGMRKLGCCRPLGPNKKQNRWYPTPMVSPAEQGTGHTIHLISKILIPSPQILHRVYLAANSGPPSATRDLWRLSRSRHHKRNRGVSQRINSSTINHDTHDLARTNSATFEMWPRPIISQQKQWQECQANSRSSTTQDWRHHPTHKGRTQAPKWQENYTRPREKSIQMTHSPY